MLQVLWSEVFNLLKKFLITFVISFIAFASSTTIAFALNGECVEDTSGNIVISVTEEQQPKIELMVVQIFHLLLHIQMVMMMKIWIVEELLLQIVIINLIFIK